MNVKDLKLRMMERLDQQGVDPFVYYTSSEQLATLNRAQRQICLMTYCIERTSTFDIAAIRWYDTISAQTQFSDILTILRVTLSTGQRLKPKTIHELDMRDYRWRVRPGTPTAYFQLGTDFIGFYPQPAVSGTQAFITYAASPALLLDDGSIPEIDEEYHEVLADMGVWWLRLKEGGTEMANTAPLLSRSMERIQRLAAHVRARAFDFRYDKGPPDLSTKDRSQELRIKIPRQPNVFTQPKPKPEELAR